MKKITIFLLIIHSCAHFSFGQQTLTETPKTKADYLKKSKSQKTVAWVLLVPGIISTGLSGVRGNPGIGGEEGMTSNQTVLLVTGLAEISTGIILFSASAKNKKKAASITFKNERLPLLQKNNFTSKAIPSLTLKISL